MAKSKEKNKALELRQRGESIKDIAKKLRVAKSTVSLWCRDIELTPKQIQRLHEKMVKGSYKGRLKGARVQHERRLRQIKQLREEGFKMVDSLSKRDLLLIGAALYWGEGMKKEGRARIANSDPEMVKFIINWFRLIWSIPQNQFTLQILINKIHQSRASEVEQYWSNLLRIPRTQFTKTTFIKTKNKKIYKNFQDHYGTLIVSVRKGSDLRHKINGLITALSKNFVNRAGVVQLARTPHS